MNYYVPYFNLYPNMVSPTLGATSSGGLFRRLLGNGINWSSILTNTQKTLGVVNQAIPVFKQVSPMVKNAKTMFKVMNEFKKEDIPTTNNLDNSNTTIVNETVNIKNSQDNVNNGPTFFIK